MGGGSDEQEEHTAPRVAAAETRRRSRHGAVHVTELPDEIVEELGAVEPPREAAQFDQEFEP